MDDKLILWEPVELEVIPPSATTALQIASVAIQLSAKDRNQIIHALDHGLYEMGVNHLWIKSMSALKRELGSLGSEFLGEMLNRSDVDEDDDAEDILSDKDALRLAEELGIVSATEGLRLRQTQELVIHFARKDFQEAELSSEQMDQAEAFRALRSCVKNILGKPKIEVAQKFVDFRSELLSTQIKVSSPSLNMLKASPYFFRKLALNILLSACRSATGALLELALGNINVLLPVLWDEIRQPEKMQVGRAYSDVYSEGLSVATQGLKKALLKVKGFDFVPETLRSDSFSKAAQEILDAHDGWDNFYSELAPVRNLEKMGSVIPAHALSSCTTALLAVKIGNCYGSSNTASPIASSMLAKYTTDRWKYYLDQCFPGDIRILMKLTEDKPRSKWIKLCNDYNFESIEIKNKNVKNLVIASLANDSSGLLKAQKKITLDYYGKRAK
jgi:hypothetical protein